MPLETVDFGGGFGVPYADCERPLDVDVLGRGLLEVAAEVAGEGPPFEHAPHFRARPIPRRRGGTYVVKVLGTKRSRGADYVLVDGGVHHFLRPALFGTPHRVSARRGRAGAEAADLSIPGNRLVRSGPLCTSPRHPPPGRAPAGPRSRRPPRLRERGRVRLHRVDAALPVPRVAGGGGSSAEGRMALLRRPPTAGSLLRAQRRRIGFRRG